MSVDLRAGRVRVAGELDRSCAHHLLDALAALALTAHPVWTLDAAAITFCDTAGLRVLARAAVLAASRGRGVRVVHCPRFLVHLLGVAGLEHLLPDGPARPPVTRGPWSGTGTDGAPPTPVGAPSRP